MHLRKKEEDEKTEFCINLEIVYDEANGKDVKIVIGDINAKIGREDVRIYTLIIEKRSKHEKTNNSVVKLIAIVAVRNAEIMSTYSKTSIFGHLLKAVASKSGYFCNSQFQVY